MTIKSLGARPRDLTMRVRPDMVNGHRICHGGLIFTLADSAFAFACNSYGDNTVAAGAAIEFLCAGPRGRCAACIGIGALALRPGGNLRDRGPEPARRAVALFRGRSHQIAGR